MSVKFEESKNGVLLIRSQDFLHIRFQLHKSTRLKSTLNKNVSPHSEVILNKWLIVFEVLSISQFNWLNQTMGFEFEVSAPVRQICRDFVSSIYVLLGRQIPGREDKLEVIDCNIDSFNQHILKIWKQNVSNLHRVDPGNQIIDWGKSSIEFRVDYPENLFFYWNKLLTKWALELDKLNPNVIMPNIHQESIDKLHHIMLVNKIKFLEVDLLLAQMREITNKDTWETYIFTQSSPTGWMASQNKFVGNMLLWKNIYDILSKDEVDNLYYWGKKYLLEEMNYNNIVFRLPPNNINYIPPEGSS